MALLTYYLVLYNVAMSSIYSIINIVVLCCVIVIALHSERYVLMQQ